MCYTVAEKISDYRNFISDIGLETLYGRYYVYNFNRIAWIISFITAIVEMISFQFVKQFELNSHKLQCNSSHARCKCKFSNVGIANLGHYF